MDIGKKLKNARLSAGLTQEQVSAEILVSRQTISNWENEKSFPDIVSVIKLSDLYSVSLDTLLKGDDEMMEHLEESTNTVNSNKKLIAAIAANILLFTLMIALSGILPDNRYFLVGVFSLATLSTAALMYQIIRRI